jgi:hypothetical protein
VAGLAVECCETSAEASLDREATHARERFVGEDGRQPSGPELHGAALLGVVAVSIVDASDVLLFGGIENPADQKTLSTVRGNLTRSTPRRSAPGCSTRLNNFGSRNGAP